VQELEGSPTGHHVVSFITISETEKSVLVADTSRPTRNEAITGEQTFTVFELVT